MTIGGRKNPKEECKAVITRSQGRVLVERRKKNSEGELEDDEKREEEKEQTRKK